MRKAFTIVELLVVISIIGILSTVTFVGVREARERTKIAKAKNDVGRIGSAVIMLYSDTRKYPVGVSGISSLNDGYGSDNKPILQGNECYIENNCNGLVTKGGYGPEWKGPYYKGDFTDPWGHKYLLDYDYFGPPHDVNPAVNDRVRQVVVSYGPDYKGGNETNDAGIYSCDDIYFEINGYTADMLSDVPSMGKSTALSAFNTYKNRCPYTMKFRGRVN